MFIFGAQMFMIHVWFSYNVHFLWILVDFQMHRFQELLAQNKVIFNSGFHGHLEILLQCCISHDFNEGNVSYSM